MYIYVTRDIYVCIIRNIVYIFYLFSFWSDARAVGATYRQGRKCGRLQVSLFEPLRLHTYTQLYVFTHLIIPTIIYIYIYIFVSINHPDN